MCLQRVRDAENRIVAVRQMDHRGCSEIRQLKVSYNVTPALRARNVLAFCLAREEFSRNKVVPQILLHLSLQRTDVFFINIRLSIVQHMLTIGNRIFFRRPRNAEGKREIFSMARVRDVAKTK